MKAPEKPTEKSVEKSAEKPTEKPMGKPVERATENVIDDSGKALLDRLDDKLYKKHLYKPMEVSEENKTRIELNVKMNKMQIFAIVAQLKFAAIATMEQGEQAWREQISIAEGSNAGKSIEKSIEKSVPPSQNNERVLQSLKK